MKRNPVVLGAALLVASVAALEPSAAAAQTIRSGRTLTVSERKLNFPKAVRACLKMCLDVVVERQTFECQGVLIPPDTGCELPWLDPDDPNPDPTGMCIPEQPEFGGWQLTERVELIDKRVTARADCTDSVSETVLQQLPNRGNPPRACPDPAGWTQTNETVQSIRFVPCS
jgi:hypothetical protein